MLKKLLSADGLWQDNGLAVIRIATGLMMAYHGLEVFHRSMMEEYMKWDVVQVLPFPELMVYLGKGTEFVSGALLALGLFGRLASLAMALNMLFVCFRIGGGRFYNEDQHPFLFAVLALIFFFAGPGKWSLDRWRTAKQAGHQENGKMK